MMPMMTIRPGETLTVVGVAQSGPVDPGYSPPWAQVPGGGQGGGPVDPGFSPPWAQVPGGGGGGQPPLVIWGPGDPRPTNPIAGMGPGGNFPGGGGGGGQPPLGIWGPNDPRPTPPIAEPPWGWGGTPPPITLPPEVPDLGPVEWKTIWTPQTGWAVIGIPTGPTPTPSK